MAIGATTFERLLDRVPAPMWLASLEAGPLWLNRAWLEFTGCSLEEGLATPWTRWVHPDDMAHVAAISLGAMERREPFETLARRRRGDGEWRWVLNRGVPYTDDNGEIVAYVGLFTDITERRQAQERLQLVLDHLGAAAFLHTPEGRILYVNREWHALFNPDGQPIEGRMLSELLPPDTVGEIRSSTEAAVEQGGRAQHEITLPTSVGPREFLVSKFVLTDPVGGVEAVCGIATDLTHVREREAHTRELEHQLAESRRLESLGVLAGGLAHDFNNLLQSVLGNASLLAAELPEDLASREYVAQIEKAAHRAADLTRQMLDYAGLSLVARDRLELATVLAEWEPLFRDHVPGHVTFRVERPDAGVPDVIGDAARLRLVLMSLATNAVEAAAQKPGRIVVRAKHRAPSPPPQHPQAHVPLPPGDYVAIEVEDDGEGMDAHVIERLWDPFFSTRFPGRGLGLPAALGIARAHGGTIEVESTPGAGSVFRLVLPAAQPSRSATRNSAP